MTLDRTLLLMKIAKCIVTRLENNYRLPLKKTKPVFKKIKNVTKIFSIRCSESSKGFLKDRPAEDYFIHQFIFENVESLLPLRCKIVTEESDENIPNSDPIQNIIPECSEDAIERFIQKMLSQCKSEELMMQNCLLKK